MADHSLNQLIELVCDAHRDHDGVGPLVTRIDGQWVYCAGNVPDGHVWRAVTPVPRSELEIL